VIGTKGKEIGESSRVEDDANLSLETYLGVIDKIGFTFAVQRCSSKVLESQRLHFISSHFSFQDQKLDK
jgi:hypothetical protein